MISRNRRTLVAKDAVKPHHNAISHGTKFALCFIVAGLALWGFVDVTTFLTQAGHVGVCIGCEVSTSKVLRIRLGGVVIEMARTVRWDCHRDPRLGPVGLRDRPPSDCETSRLHS